MHFDSLSCFGALSRKRFLAKHRPGHNRVFWDATLGKWLSYNKEEVIRKHLDDPFIWMWYGSVENITRPGMIYSPYLVD